MVEMDRRQREINPATREGVKRRILALTDDEELAEKTATDFAVQQKLANMAASNANQGNQQ
jgi:hypothetical protein